MRARSAPTSAWRLSFPITVLAIFLILYAMFRSSKWAILVLVSVIMASIGGPLALFLTRYEFLGVVGGRIPGAVRGIGADGRNHA